MSHSYTARRDVTRWGSSILIAVFVHAAAAAALILDFGFGAAEPVAMPMAAMTVELAVLPTAPEPRVTEVPPGPQQVESEARPRPKEKPPTFEPPPETERPPPDALAAKLDVPVEPEQLTAADQTTDVPTNLAQEQDALKAPQTGVSHEPTVNVVQTWESSLLTHLERFKRYPGAAQKRRQEDTIYLRFTMDRRGEVIDWKIERSAGHALLDAEVGRLIRRASPLPPPPQEVAGNTVEMLVPVEFFLSKRFVQVTSP
ncbi:energy transducer TonB family protein [Peristeroidobacter soli]|jgi:protein TonB|uniref:energy transducer TonB family protein n=1 Tax=Peristeroidobacter soli TaxID=2497877 RepID=UPI00101B9464|nr:TonB family protein [Peristeroidobacter soli]